VAELDDKQVRTYRRQAALKSFEPQLLLARQMARGESASSLYEIAGDTIGRDTPVHYLEFGVAGGGSIRKMCGIFANSGSEFVGFDSFEGLPVKWEHHVRGAFSTDSALPRSNDTRVRFVKGCFQNKLPGYLADIRGRLDKPVLVHYDADLYSSTPFILTCLWLDIPEYYFLFDEFFFDEVVALRDFASAFPVTLAFFAKTGGPMHVFGKLTRTELTLR